VALSFPMAPYSNNKRQEIPEAENWIIRTVRRLRSTIRSGRIVREHPHFTTRIALLSRTQLS